MAMLATDRCDRCGAQAVVSADSPTWLSPLLFCAHHYKEHSLELYHQGAILFDDREGSEVAS